MSNRTSVAARLAFVSALILLLSAPVFAMQPAYNGDRITTTGRITRITQDDDSYRVMLNHGGYEFYVPMGVVGDRALRVGDEVRVSGIINGDEVNADSLSFAGRYYTNDRGYVNDRGYYRSVPYGQTGWMSGTLQSTNRHYHYITMVDDNTGALVRVDVRHMNYRFDMDDAHAGDHISVLGNWENRDVFDAQRIRY